MEALIRQFRLSGAIDRTEPFGGGHINDTYRLTNRFPAEPDYLLQRINHRVFPDVSGLMENIALVTAHLRQRIAAAPPPANLQTTLTLVPTHTGAYYYHHDRGYWRIFVFLKGMQAFDLVSTPAQAYAGARAYGYFLRFLDDFPPERLTAVIPGFHDLALRLRQFQAAQYAPAAGRGSRCREDVRRVLGLADRLLVLDTLYHQGKIRSRVTHNDTKFNNVLLSEEGHGKCVIDLDTVMPGIVHFDFGDGVRTGVTTAQEDEADLSRVTVDTEKFRAFAAGYLEVTRDVLSEVERVHLALSGAYMAFLMGVRFLTDYLAGDTYYKVSGPEHNLVRARNQLRLTEEFLARLPDLQELVKRA